MTAAEETVTQFTQEIKALLPVRRTKKRQRKPSSSKSRILNLILSDLHLGAWLEKGEVPFPYGPEEECQALSYIAQETADYKTQHRDHTQLDIHCLGDLIEGFLHDPRAGAPLTTQFSVAVCYLVQLIDFLSQEFNSVVVRSTPGNHGRMLAVHKDRPIYRKWDSIETMIMIAVEQIIMSTRDNVTFERSNAPFYTAPLFDAMGFYTHGDTVLKVGNPAGSINTKSLYTQVCKWNNARGIGGPFSLFAAGHAHCGTISHLPGRVGFVINGCVVPPGPFSLSIGEPDVARGQWLIESVPGFPLGDQRFLSLDGAKATRIIEPCISCKLPTKKTMKSSIPTPVK